MTADEITKINLNHVFEFLDKNVYYEAKFSEDEIKLLKNIYQEPEEVRNKTEFNKSGIEEEVKGENTLFTELNKPQNRLFIIGLLISCIISVFIWHLVCKFSKKELHVTKDKKNK